MTEFEQQVADALDDLERDEEQWRYSAVERDAIRDFLRLRAPRIAAATEVAAQAGAVGERGADVALQVLREKQEKP